MGKCLRVSGCEREKESISDKNLLKTGFSREEEKMNLCALYVCYKVDVGVLFVLAPAYPVGP